MSPQLETITCVDQAADYYMEDRNLPVFRKGMSNGMPTKEIINTMITIDSISPKVCQRIPIGVNNNAVFLINTEKLGHNKDLMSDGCGTWAQTSTKYKYFFRKDSDYIEIPQSGYGTDGLIKVKRLSYRHSTSTDFHRIIMYVNLHNGVGDHEHSIACLQYFFENEEHSVSVPAHKSSKTDIPFHRTFESTKAAIKTNISKQKKISPAETVHGLLEEKGGLYNIQAPGELIRGRHQVSNFKYSIKPEASDPLLEVMELCKLEAQNPSTSFLREVTGSPEMCIFMATNQQLEDVKRFCTNPKQFCVLGVDATFNIGDYYLTLTTYRNLMLSTKKGTHPVFIGPALIHQRRLFDSYFSLPSNMLKYCPELQRLIVYGSDGEKNITDSFDTCFSFSKHLLCDIHMKDNIVKKMTALNIVGETGTQFLNEIFGKQIGQLKQRGLVDSNSTEEFDQSLDILKDKWSERHSNGAEFLTYFKTYKVDLIKNSMTADIRSMAGLGYPPKMYNQNANECMNSVVKRDLKWIRLNPKEAVEHLHHIVRRQHEEAKMAMIGRGEYQLMPLYQEYRMDESNYYKMTRFQKEAREKKFFSAIVKGDDICAESSDRDKINNELSVAPSESNIVNVPHQSVLEMFQKAAQMCSTPGEIVKAPIASGNGNIYYAASTSNPETPHQVRIIGKSGQFSCDKNCLRWSTFKVCSHVLAVAEHVGSLKTFLTWFGKAQRAPNYTALSNSNMPSNRGKKATKATQKRKGGNPNKPQSAVLGYIDRPSTNKKPALPDPASGSYIVTLLKFCHEKTSICFSCKGRFKDNEYPCDPRDLIIVTKGQREYMKDGEKRQAKMGNIYFHFNEKCVVKYDCYFLPCLVRVQEDAKTYLTEKHKQLLEHANVDF